MRRNHPPPKKHHSPHSYRPKVIGKTHIPNWALVVYFFTTVALMCAGIPLISSYAFLVPVLTTALFLGMVYRGVFHQARLHWNDEEVWYTEPANKVRWKEKWKDLLTVATDDSNTFSLYFHGQALSLGQWSNRDLQKIAPVIGRHLVDSERTESARPFLSFDVDPKIIRKSTLKLVVQILIGILGLPLCLFVQSYILPWRKIFAIILAPLFIAHLFAAYETHKKLKRARLAARLPRLLDQNRDIELEIYEEFTPDEVDAAARFYRHIWSHNPQNAFQLLPQATQKRLLAHADKTPNKP